MNQDESTHPPLQDVSLASDIYHDNVAALNLGESNAKDPTKKSRLSRSGAEKIDEIYSSVHAIEKVVKLIERTKDYLSTVTDPKQVKLAVDTLSFSTEAIANRLKCISNCSNNTKEKKDAHQAHAKLSKRKRHEDEERMFILKRTMKDNPRGALMAELKAVKESFAKSTSLGRIAEDEHTLLPRKRSHLDQEVRIIS